MKKNRNLRLEWWAPKSLDNNPHNWRRHPDSQRRALRGLHKEAGFAGALLYNERTKRLIDGHLRREEWIDLPEVPVLIGEWTEAQEKKILAALDNITARADVDTGALEELIADLEPSDEDFAALIEDIAATIPVDVAAELRKLDIQPPPKMSWVLIGIPTVRFAEISADVERMAKIKGITVETTVNDGPKQKAERSETAR